MVGLTKRQDDASRDIAALSAKLAEPGVNKAEFSTAIVALGDSIKSIQEEMNRIKNAKTMRAGQVDILTVRSLLPRNQGKKMIEILLHEPIDLHSHPEGELIKATRNAFDTAMLVDAYMRTKGGASYGGIQTLKSWGNFVQLAGYYDPEFAKAMSNDNTGYGLEWIWQGWSRELYDLFNLDRVLAAKFPTFEMPSESYKWPIKTSHASVYLADDPNTNNPDELTKSNWGTSNVTFTAHTHAAAIMISEVMTEDSIIPVVPAVMEELAWSLRDGEDNALINSDTTSTHRDTSRTAAAGTLYNLTGFMGLRFRAVDNTATYDTQATTAGTGDAATTFGADDIRQLRKMMGKHGTRKGYFYLTGIGGYFLTISLTPFVQGGNYNTLGTWNNGVLTTLDGGDLIVSENINSIMGADGLLTGSNASHTIYLCVQPAGFKIGHRRNIGVDYQFNNLTRQYAFVGTMRMDFQQMTPTGEDPVALGYNIEIA
jgi:HK97 family phage major capsid protein